jgi:ABC-type transport system involved in multi-copper enzyme maturation permease subunit
VAGVIGRVSPSPSWVYSAVALANTGEAARQSLKDANDRFGKYIDELFRSSQGRGPEFSKDRLPEFTVAPPTSGEAVRNALNDVLILSIINVLFFMLSFMVFLRYDVR